jgi:hypothetical protein
MDNIEFINQLIAEHTRQVQILQQERAIALNLTLYRIDERGAVVPISAKDYFR